MLRQAELTDKEIDAVFTDAAGTNMDYYHEICHRQIVKLASLPIDGLKNPHKHFRQCLAAEPSDCEKGDDVSCDKPCDVVEAEPIKDNKIRLSPIEWDCECGENPHRNFCPVYAIDLARVSYEAEANRQMEEKCKNCSKVERLEKIHHDDWIYQNKLTQQILELEAKVKQLQGMMLTEGQYGLAKFYLENIDACVLVLAKLREQSKQGEIKMDNRDKALLELCAKCPHSYPKDCVICETAFNSGWKAADMEQKILDMVDNA